MDRSGKIHLGTSYEKKIEKLQRITGQKNHPDTMRAVIDNLLFDAEVKGITKAQPQTIGFKELSATK